MAPPAEPYIDIVTGHTYGNIDSPGTFSWYNSKAIGQNSCTVAGTGNWCDSSSYGPISPQSSVTASVLPGLPSTNYPWACPCCMLGNPSAPVHGVHPFPPKK